MRTLAARALQAVVPKRVEVRDITDDAAVGRSYM
jgi:hypothetical protein